MLRRRTVGPRRDIKQTTTSNAKTRGSYINAAVLEPFAKDLLYGTLVFSFDNAGGGGEYPEGTVAHAGVVRLAGLEQRSKEFHPVFACQCPREVSRPYTGAGSRKIRDVPLSTYSRAISAIASPILFLTGLTCSRARPSNNFDRIAPLTSVLRVRNVSLLSPVAGFFRDRADCLRNKTAANDRV